MTDDELKALVASLAVAQHELTEKMNRTDEKLERMSIHLGNIIQNQGDIAEDFFYKNLIKDNRFGSISFDDITHNQGDVAEEFFYQSLIKDNRLGSIRFDDITKNMQKHRGTIQAEYDLFMTNGDAIAVVEVKYKAHSHDIDKLDRKMRHFKPLFPIYQNYKLYGALASFHINDDTREEALKRGYFVLQRCGEIIQSECGDHLCVL